MSEQHAPTLDRFLNGDYVQKKPDWDIADTSWKVGKSHQFFVKHNYHPLALSLLQVAGLEIFEARAILVLPLMVRCSFPHAAQPTLAARLSVLGVGGFAGNASVLPRRISLLRSTTASTNSLPVCRQSAKQW